MFYTRNYSKLYQNPQESKSEYGNCYHNSSVERLERTQQQPQQLSLFPPKDDPPPYPLQIISIPDQKRLKPDWCCKLVRYESGLKIGGQFTIEEAQEILETTLYWDFTLDKDRVPRCRDKLLLLLEKVCARPDSDKEVAA